MIVCPNCDHQNPDGATQCEACYTPLATIPLSPMSYCPNCGSSVEANATFCGQCGHNLQPEELPAEVSSVATETMATPPVTVQSLPPEPIKPKASNPPPIMPTPSPEIDADETALDWQPPEPLSVTRLQIQSASLLHLQTNQPIEIPQGLSVIHLGKPNERIPPDIDVSGFPDSDIVSRIHADIRVEGDTYYIEDTGSSNGTYINHSPLFPGDRHRLRSGDRIALGKGDKVTFIFQLS